MKGIRDTSSKTYRQLMSNGLQYIIPKFQRDYSWEIEQWDDVWQDKPACAWHADKGLSGIKARF